MCSTNILSSYCVTVLPLAAYMAFKKIIVLFVLILAIVMNLQHKFNWFQYGCIFVIVVGGILVGERDIINGQSIGYIAVFLYNMCEAGSL
jgi:drug/metabolite transporter (DMT)-like permease